MGKQVGKRKGYIASHRVSYHHALFHMGIIQHSLDGASHEVHGVHFVETFAVSVSGEVDSDDMHGTHKGKDIGTPDI